MVVLSLGNIKIGNPTLYVEFLQPVTLVCLMIIGSSWVIRSYAKSEPALILSKSSEYGTILEAAEFPS